ncbi:hypothetical protein BKA70DRAFT_1560826 [Coprinopsis sp. MPI-PUGE-AT-0042]|nr:hypothetical protein BKA70DRAFT_1560826 [Coprinopsis sp. MPI-PUGE-AT-0042]
MDAPPQLSPYLSSNNPLPEHLKPYLGMFLGTISNSIAELDADIDQLERELEAKRQRREQYKKDYQKHSQLQASIRRIPPEIWGIIFGFALGDEPFGLWMYRTYGYLRQVCWNWRDVAASTPDICRGLVVDLDGPLTWTPDRDDTEGVWCLKKKLEPWLAIVSRNHPYHLVLGLEDDESYEWTEHVTDILQWILTTMPTPTILSLTTSGIFSMVYVNAPQDNKITHLTLDFWQDLDREALEETPFQAVFPCLKTLFIDAPIEFLSPMRHSNLQSLTLAHVYGSQYHFSTFLLDMPALRELRLNCQDPYYYHSDPSLDPLTLIHPALEILIIEGEDLMLLLEHIAFPSLKFLGLSTCLLDNKNFVASIRGTPRKFIFDLVMHNIPLGSRIHLNTAINWELDDDEEIEVPPLLAPNPVRTFIAICCSQRPDGMDWLYSQHIRSADNRSTQLYVPKGVMEGDMEVELGDRLRDRGDELHTLEEDVYRTLLRSWIPQMTVQWEI